MTEPAPPQAARDPLLIAERSYAAARDIEHKDRRDSVRIAIATFLRAEADNGPQSWWEPSDPCRFLHQLAAEVERRGEKP
jgi:hypothetical protein